MCKSISLLFLFSSEQPTAVSSNQLQPSGSDWLINWGSVSHLAFPHRHQHALWLIDVTQLLHWFCCWSLIGLCRHCAWLSRGYWDSKSLIGWFDWLIDILLCSGLWNRPNTNHFPTSTAPLLPWHCEIPPSGISGVEEEPTRTNVGLGTHLAPVRPTTVVPPSHFFLVLRQSCRGHDPLLEVMLGTEATPV